MTALPDCSHAESGVNYKLRHGHLPMQICETASAVRGEKEKDDSRLKTIATEDSRAVYQGSSTWTIKQRPSQRKDAPHYKFRQC